jgi:hypothetical protein
MKKISTLLILLSALLIRVCAAESSSSRVKQGQWIKSWLVFSLPVQETDDFNKDYLASIGGETNPDLKERGIINFPNGSAKVVLYNSPDSVVNFNQAKKGMIGYAFTEIKLNESKLWFVSFGINKNGALWVNGDKVWENTGKGPLTRYLIPVNLKKGKNSILFKVKGNADKNQFFARIEPFSSKKLIKKGELFRITVDENGEPQLSSYYLSPVIKQIIKKADLEIFDHLGNPVLKNQLTENFTPKLAMNKSDFRSYHAKLTISLRNGEILNQSLFFNAGLRKEYTLFSDRNTAYRIVLDSNASESENWSAQELQHWLGEISGAWFPIQTFDKKFKGPQIIIGYNDYVKRNSAANAPMNSDESFTYCNNGSDIMIYGGKQRGTMYGVMSFLENEFGCRFYTPTVSVIPKRQEHKFYFYDHSEKPGIRVRNDFYFEAFDPIWAARNKMNGRMNYAAQPGGVEAYWSVHTFFKLINPDEFYSSHPEYFSLINGKRVQEHSQLCLTNPDVLKIMIERIKERMKESPEYLIYDVSQNDWHNACQCEKCQALVKQEGSESGPVIWFVNQVAEAVEKEFPDKFIGTLAYQYTRKPPKTIKPRQNVVVRLCPIEACVSHTLEECPQNKSFMEDLRGWSKIAPHLYIWDYVVNFGHYIMPYPNFNVLQANIRTFRENNAIGIMEQAAYQSRGGEFAELKAYLISKLLWNPDCNTEAVINDFIYGYYGRAGQYIRRYFDLLNNRITPETHMHIHLSPEDKLFSEEMISQSCYLFTQALKEADNEEIMRRVEMAYLPVLYLKCKRNPVLSRYDGTYERFSNIAKREGITHYAEYKDAVFYFNKEIENAK